MLNETSPEIELLLGCARATLDEASVARLSNLGRQGLDWTALYHLADAQGVVPLIYHRLNEICSGVLENGPAEKFRDHYLANFLNSNLLIKKLIQILDAFDQNGIRVVPVKGPILAACAYGDPLLREFGDLDLLIRPEDRRNAADLLSSMGFQPVFQDPGAYMVVQDHQGIMVDIQWQLRGPSFFFPFEFDHLWSQRQFVTLDGNEVAVMAPEETLILVCVHGCKHYWNRLRLVCDVAYMVHAHQEVHWPRVMNQAGSMGIQRMILLGLDLARDLLGTELSPELAERIQADATIGQLCRRVKSRLFIEVRDYATAQRIIFNLMLRDRLWEKARYLMLFANNNPLVLL